MQLSDCLAYLEASPVGATIAGSNLLFPVIETVHVLAIVLVVGTIMIVDLRLLNVASKQRALSELVREVLPWTWIAFVGAVVSGGLLFSSAAVQYSQNPSFLYKMVMLLLAGINMAAFHLGAYRHVDAWDTGPAIPASARVAGALSLLIWTSIVAFGRWIGFA